MNQLLLEQLLNNADTHQVINELYIFLNWVIIKTDRYAMSTMLTGMPGMVDPFGMNTCHESIIGSNACTIAEEFLLSNETLKKAIGMAALKAILPDVPTYMKGNSIDLFKNMSETKSTCFIGHFQEAAAMRTAGFPVNIIELFPRPGDIHWDNSHDVLSKAKVVFMTGLTLVNNTFDEVIRRTPEAEYRIIMGPTVPLSKCLFNFGIWSAGSTLIRNPDTTIRYCQRGGGSIAYAPDGALEKVTISRN